MVLMIFIWNILLFQLTSPLRITLKSAAIPLQAVSQDALKEIFVELRSTGQYDSTVELLSMKTFDAKDAYVNSCSSMQSNEYKDIIEHFYTNNNHEQLALVLSAECIASMDKSIFRDATFCHSFKDLPVSVLGTEKVPFNFRNKSSSGVFCSIVSHSQSQLYRDTIWDNLVAKPPYSLRSSDRISLKQALTTCKFNKINFNDLFYYLNPTMITNSDFVEDILWLIELASPNITSYPQIDVIKSSKFIDKKYLNALNLQLFKTVTTIAFYFEIKKISLSSTKIRLRQTLDEGEASIWKSLEALSNTASSLLNLNPPCPPFRNLLSMIKTLVHLFFPELNPSVGLVTKYEVNQLFKSILYSFKNYSPQHIQGDWLYNLFYIYIVNNYDQKGAHQIFPLSSYSLAAGLTTFFGRSPTNSSIHKLHFLFGTVGSSLTRKSIFEEFEKAIPADRLKEIFTRRIVPLSFIQTRFEEISLEDRFAHLLKESRANIANIDSRYTGKAHLFPSVQNMFQVPKRLRRKFLIETFQSTVLALYRQELNFNSIYPYGKFEIIEKDLTRKVDIRECLQQFFDLILMIPEFRIVKDFTNDKQKPIIYITPLITVPVANILGQSMALAVILNVRIPFIIHPDQLSSIFNQDPCPSDIVTLCKGSPYYLNLLKIDKNNSFSSLFRNSFKSYMRSMRFMNVWIDTDCSVDKLVNDSALMFHSLFFAGFNRHFQFAQLNFEESKEFLSK